MVMFLALREGFISHCTCGRHKKRRKEEKPEVSVGEKLRKNVDLEEPTPPLDQVFLACTQRDCKTNKRIVEENRNLFESLISAGTVKPMPGWE